MGLLDGLLGKAADLGDQAASWVGAGQNKPVSQDGHQLEQGLAGLRKLMGS